MKIAITGCNGRVGRPTVKAALARGHEVVGIDTTPPPPTDGMKFTFHTADLSDFELTLKVLKGCDAVIHLAGAPNPGDFKVETHNTNVTLSWNVLRACAELGINRVAQASSVNILKMVFSTGCAFEYFPIDETHPCTPDEPYGLSKLIAETQASSIVRRYPNMRIASLRLSWSVPQRKMSADRDPYEAWTARDLWGYVHEDSAADAFVRAVTVTHMCNGYANGKQFANGFTVNGGGKAVNGGVANGHPNNGVNGAAIKQQQQNNDIVKGRTTVQANGHAKLLPSPTTPVCWTSGHEAFFIVAPEIAPQGDSKTLKEHFYPDVPVREGYTIEGLTGFFDCGKAKRYLGWVHKDP